LTDLIWANYFPRDLYLIWGHSKGFQGIDVAQGNEPLFADLLMGVELAWSI
jgi:hypothetical protein